MTNSGKATLELTESQLLSIKNRIKTWSTKEKVIEIMRYRFGQVENHAAWMITLYLNKWLVYWDHRLKQKDQTNPRKFKID